jgi:hypothetical protein
MALAPPSLEPQVEIAERAGQRDLADMGRAGEGRGLASKTARARSTLLAGAPARADGGSRRAEAFLVDLQQGGVHDAVGQRCKGERGEAVAAGRDDHAAAGRKIQELGDDTGIVEGCPVLQNQRRYLADRVEPADRVVRVCRVGRFDLTRSLSPQSAAVI